MVRKERFTRMLMIVTNNPYIPVVLILPESGSEPCLVRIAERVLLSSDTGCLLMRLNFMTSF
jgi:hypothetical protein